MFEIWRKIRSSLRRGADAVKRFVEFVIKIVFWRAFVLGCAFALWWGYSWYIWQYTEDVSHYATYSERYEVLRVCRATAIELDVIVVGESGHPKRETFRADFYGAQKKIQEKYISLGKESRSITVYRGERHLPWYLYPFKDNKYDTPCSLVCF